MSDPSSELKEAMERMIDQRFRSMAADMGLEAGSRAADSVLGGATDQEFDQTFATAYDGTNTTMPFMRGVSLWGVDVWSG